MTSKNSVYTVTRKNAGNSREDNNESMQRSEHISKQKFNLMKHIDNEILETHKKLSLLRKELEIICEMRNAKINIAPGVKNKVPDKVNNSSRNDLKAKNREQFNGNSEAIPSYTTSAFGKDKILVSKPTNSLNREQLYRKKVCQFLSNQNKANSQDEVVLPQSGLIDSLSTKITNQLKSYIDNALETQPLQTKPKSKVFRSVAVETSLDNIKESSPTLISLFDQTSYLNLPDIHNKEEQIKSQPSKAKGSHLSRLQFSFDECELPFELDIVKDRMVPRDDTIPSMPDSLLYGNASPRNTWDVPSNSSTPKRHSSQDVPSTTSTPKVGREQIHHYSPPSFTIADASLSGLQYSELSALNSLDISKLNRSNFWKDVLANAQSQSNE